MKYLVLCLLTTVAMTSASFAACQPGKVPATMRGVNDRGQSYSAQFFPNGQFSAKSTAIQKGNNAGREIYDTGSWTCRGGRVCLQFNQWERSGCR